MYPRGSGWKEAATYSPALHCSTIGASGLNFSVRNGKRWDPTAITTWCLVFSSLVRSWQVDKLFVLFAAVITSSNLSTRLLVNCFCWRVDCWQVDKLFVSFAAVITSSNLSTRLLVNCFCWHVDWLTSYLSHLSLLLYQATCLLIYRLLVYY